MDPSTSRILINELVIPVRGERGRFGPSSDFNMMSVVAGMERTEPQWRDLLGSAGLKIEKIWTADVVSESIIEVVVDMEANGSAA